MTRTHASPDDSAARGPLSSVRVLDLTHMLSGPYATMLMADMGAEIIKIEPPARGEATRALLAADPEHSLHGMGAYFLTLGRNKLSVGLDLKRPRGRALLHELTRHADVVVSNFRAGVLERLELDHPRLAAINPRVVTCSITGFGETGPNRAHTSLDMVAQATGGGMSVTGDGDRPLRAGIPIGDLGGGLMATIGVLAALQARTVTGRGQHVDISMQDVQISLLNYMATMYLMSGRPPPAVGNAHFVHVPYDVFPTRDGHVVIAVITDEAWAGLVRALELDELDTAAHRDQPGRLRHKHLINARLSALLRTNTREHWLARLRAHAVPCAPVNSLADALADPHVLARRMVVEVPHALGGSARQPGNPIKMSEAGRESFRAPPLLGQHTDEVLRRLLGLDPDALAELRDAGVIR